MAAATKPSHASVKSHPASRPLSAATSNAARAAMPAGKQPAAAAQPRRQSMRNAGGVLSKECGGDVPKGAVVTSYAVAQAQGSGRQRKSSEEVFLPAGLPCFVT